MLFSSSTMANNSRKKRNFKNLTLDNSINDVIEPEGTDTLANATAASSKTRLSSEASNGIRPRNSSLPTSGLVASRERPRPRGSSDYSKLCEHLSGLEIGLELRLDLRAEDLKTLGELGAGNGGTVCRVMHIPTETVMARKIIHIDAKPTVRKQIMRELQFAHDCNSEHIVSFYGAFTTEGDINICMEYMDVGSLDKIYKKNGPIPMDILPQIAYAVVDGLIYLYDNHRIIHRDVKPSNVLINSSGQIKICDFGVSGQLINSIADTFVGTSSYMSPERIQGAPYTVKSDVWSLGITIMELALGRFPFPADGTALSIFELLQHIVHEAVPTLPPGKYPEDLEDFLARCLMKDVDKRATPSELKSHPYLQNAMSHKVDLQGWAASVNSI
ncbi:hypothetical protein BZG36_04378 [Bifiguratus adelaidae]|uniref:Protein kinase domain-containing protein n=1 Tax=Bifiguratus adelaidae TaxID=1938954 RepID=A0A261XVH5_9FUNG|nr:hypothetical protein BZG36_04378 [Bifiguratus adelaidae]